MSNYEQDIRRSEKDVIVRLTSVVPPFCQEVLHRKLKKKTMISVEQCRLVLALAVLSSVSTGVSSLQCYRCLVDPLPGDYYNTTNNLCENFDYSEKYIVDCPLSTMCMKQEFYTALGAKQIKSIMRDCAAQTYESYSFEKKAWMKEVMEPYQEGCAVVDDKGERTTNFNQYCYCRKNLCNASPTTNHEGYTDIMGVIVVFNLMKYINSLR